ncbi:MAG: NIPSNAP family protein [Pseudomonadota bacterium]
MIVDHRTYTIQPGAVPKFLEIYKSKGWPIQQEYLGDCVGWYVSMDIGQLNQIVHMWRFKDLNDRAERRSRMQAASGWSEYLATATPLIQHMENKILSAAPFFDGG